MKLLFKRLSCLLTVAIVLMSCMCMDAFAVSPSEAKKSVVVVISQDGGSYGSGFAIGEVGKPIEFIVTNNHVVKGKGHEGNTTATVAFSLASGKTMLANIYYNNAEKDIAVLKLPEPSEEREAMVLCPMKYANPDDDFAALGYPSNQATDWPKYNMDDITITKGGIKKQDRVNGLDVYMLDLTITHGNSGGPLVNSDGEVVGINTFGLNADNYAIAIDELLRVIDTDRIPVTLHSSGQLSFIIIGAVVLVLIIVLLVVLFMRKKKEDTLQDQIVPPSPPPAPSPSPVPPTPNAPGARIVAVGGPLNGRKYTVNGTVKLGRDSTRCGITFPVNTQGVSAVHCEVTFDGTVCFVKDLNSTYGTFASDGSKLLPNAPQVLQSGDKFYLASPLNTFEVRF